jgi:multiple sugar transport system substrate-binding protein
MFDDEPRSRRRFLTDTARGGAGLAAGAAALGAATHVQAARPAANPVAITYLDYQKPRVQWVDRWIPKFQAATAAAGHPIKINHQVGPTPDVDFKTKITVEYAANNGPDVSAYGQNWLAPFVSAGYLLDLTPYVSKWSDWSTKYYPIVTKQCTVGGKVYAVPQEAGLEMLFYRKDILDKYHISTAQPTSWADLLDRGREIKRKTGKYALLFDAGVQWGGGVWEEAFGPMMLGTHSPIYDEAAKKWIVRSKGLLQAFQFYETLYKEQLMPIQPLLNPSPWIIPKYKMFPAGQLVVSVGGSWSWQFDWGPHGAGPIPHELAALGTWNFPTQDGSGKPYVWAGTGYVYTIAANSSHPQEAFEFIKYLTQPKPSADELYTIGAISPRKDTRGTAPYSLLPYIVSTESQLTTGKYFPSHDGQDQWETYIAQATEAIITGRANAQQALDQFAAACKKGLGASNVTEE